uniref:Uncharacterized protein n=1 Tax=Panagrolaimus sp. JU765 TaxID=591449 RepID=A0AC34R553_9BILA
MASASEVAFFSYIYARLEKDQYRKLTSWTRAGTMGGRTFGYLTSQFIILMGLGTYRTLNCIAFVLPCIVLIFCLLLPRVHWKTMVSRMAESRERSASKQHKRHRPLPTKYSEYILYRTRKLKSDFIKIYSVGFIRKWSFWWAMTTCMSLQVAQYAQTLWGEVQVNKDSPLNGFAEAGYTFTSTFAILAMNAIPINWDKWGETALVLISSIDAGLLVLYSQTQSIYVMYGCYIGYRSLYQVMITIAQWNIAKKMVCESYGLVFGVNSFIALIMQSIIMFVVADKRGLGMRVREQYLVYAGCHMLIAIIFAISVAITVVSWLIFKYRTKGKHVDEHHDTAAVIERQVSRKSTKSAKIEPMELSVATVVNPVVEIPLDSSSEPTTPKSNDLEQLENDFDQFDSDSFDSDEFNSEEEQQ